MAKRSLKKLDALIAKGENPNGFTAQTVNGTAKATGTGWNRQMDWQMPELSPAPVWPDGSSNRTGE